MEVYKEFETENIIIFNIYYKRYGLIDTQITYIKKYNRIITKVKSEICSIKTIFY